MDSGGRWLNHKVQIPSQLLTVRLVTPGVVLHLAEPISSWMGPYGWLSRRTVKMSTESEHVSL